MLKKQQRITNNKDFQNIYRRGRHSSSAFFGLKQTGNIFRFPRIGIVVGKKTARKAHDRNLIKRRLREILHAHYREIKPGKDIVILAHAATLGLDFSKLEKELLDILNKANLLRS